jgi:hypothetical protein
MLRAELDHEVGLGAGPGCGEYARAGGGDVLDGQRADATRRAGDEYGVTGRGCEGV